MADDLPPGFVLTPEKSARPKMVPKGDELPPGFEINPNREGTPLQKTEDMFGGFGRWLGKQATAAKEFVTSTGEYAPKIDPGTGKPYPEIGSASLGKGFMGTLREAYVGGLFNLETDPKYRANLIKKYFPKVKSVDIDKDGDPIFTLRNGKKYILNQRGASMQDLSDTTSFLGKAAVGGVLGTGPTILSTALRSGLTFAGGTALEDVGSNVAGSGRPVGPETAVRVVGGGVLGALGGAGGHALFRALSSASRMGSFVTPRGKLTVTAKRILRKAGVDPSDISAADARALNAMLPKASNAEEARRMLLGQKFGVKLTKGQVTRHPNDMRGERFIAESVQDVETPNMADLRKYLTGGQHERLAVAGSDIVRGMTGKSPVSYTGEVMGRTQKVLYTLSKREQTAVNRAYKAARDAGEVVPIEDAKALYGQIKSHLQENYGPAERASLEQFQKLIKENPDGVPLKLLESVRKQWGNTSPLNTAFKSSQDAKAILDEGVNTPLFVKARTRHMEMSGKFKDDKTIASLIKTDTDASGKMSSDLVVSPDEAVKKVFGTGSGKLGTARTLRRMKSILGEKSQAWQDVRLEAASRLFTSQRFDTAFETAMKGDRTVMASLFSKQELKNMADYAQLVKIIKSDPTANTSKTSYNTLWAMNKMRGLKEIVSGAAPRALRLVINNQVAGSALRGVPMPPVKPIFPGLTGQTFREGTPD